MNKRCNVTGILLAAALFFAGIFSINASAAEEAKQVDIMFLHDTHSHLNEFTTVENGQSQIMEKSPASKSRVSGLASFCLLIKVLILANPPMI